MLAKPVLEPAAAPNPGTFAAPRSPWGVSALLLATGDALAARFGAVAVRGELSGLVRAASGHFYFSLKDAGGAGGVLRCAMFRRSASLLDFQPADGQQVDVRGRLGVYEARGELQLVVESMQRVGAGSLYEEFLRLRARLQGLGLFDAGRKRPISPFPHAVGVVTSLGAAALRDVLTTLKRRAPHLHVVVYPSPVQGAEAPAALVAALQEAGRRAEVDTLLLVRGGGALEDLWAFNDERVVQRRGRLPACRWCAAWATKPTSRCATWPPTCVHPPPPPRPSWLRRCATRRWPCCRRATRPCSAPCSGRCSSTRSAWTRWPCAWASPAVPCGARTNG